MKKNKKVKAEIRLDSNRVIKIKGIAKDFRTVFGREEILVDVQEVEPCG